MLAALLDFAGRRSQTPQRPEAQPPVGGHLTEPDAPAAAVIPITTPPAPRKPAGIDAGICYHPAHVDLDALGRYGVTPIPSSDMSRAALTRCVYSNPAGR